MWKKYKWNENVTVIKQATKKQSKFWIQFECDMNAKRSQVAIRLIKLNN